MRRNVSRWLLATAIAGSLDLASAFAFSSLAGAGPAKVLGFVASGPFGDAMLTAGLIAILLGIVVHFSLMAIMVAVYVVTADRIALVERRPWLAGSAYGLLLWVVMYFIVRPLRWPNMPLPHTALGIAEQLFSHLALVGIPVALIISGGWADLLGSRGTDHAKAGD